MVWARPSVNVLGIDCPPVVGSTPSLRASARARVSVRIPAGTDPTEAMEALAAHLEAAAPLRAPCRDRALGDRGAVCRDDRRRGLPGDRAGDADRLRGRADDRRPGRFDPALQRPRRELPRGGDHLARRRGAALPDPRPERDRSTPARSSASPSPRRCSCAITPGRAPSSARQQQLLNREVLQRPVGPLLRRAQAVAIRKCHSFSRR